MCGIAGFHIKPAAKGTIEAGYLMDWLLKGIEHRGREATGFMAIGFDNQMVMDKAACSAMEFVPKRKAIKSAPQTVLAHTRLATQGPVEDMANNHPVQYGTFFVTHNGWIVNDDEIFQKSGLERTADVDTVAIPAVLWNYNEDGFNHTNVKYALEQLEGAVALAAVDIKRQGELLLARGNSSPLYVLETSKIIIWASTIEAIQTAWGKVFGTPPAKERFIEFAEGDAWLIKDGEVEHKFTFTPTWATRYNWGYSSLDYDDDWYTKRYGEQMNLDRAIEESQGAAGTWLNLPDGSRTYVPVGMEAPKPRPSAKDITILRSMGAWAKLDSQAHENTIYELANQLKLPMTMVAWLAFYVDSEVVDANPSVKVAQEWITEHYSETYDEELNLLLAAVPGEVDPSEALVVPITTPPDGGPDEEADRPFDPNSCPECESRMTGGKICPDCEMLLNRLGYVVSEDMQMNPTSPVPVDRSLICIRCQENLTQSALDYYCGSCISADDKLKAAMQIAEAEGV